MKLRALTLTILLLTTFHSAIADDDDTVLTPLPLKANEFRVGERVADLSFVDIDEKSGKLSDYGSQDAIVIVLNKIDCPICQKYSPRLNQLEKEYSAKKVTFLMVNVGKHSVDKLKQAISLYGYKGRYVPDYDNILSGHLLGKTSGEVFILDKTRTLRYRGPIDDQHGVGVSKPEPKHHYLKDALDSVLAGRIVRDAALVAPGCALSLKAITEVTSPLTYNNQISRIIQVNCQRCHRPGESAPFSLMTYSDVKDNARMVSYMVKKGLMPPWTASSKHGAWVNDASLSARHREQLVKWLGESLAEGDSADAPLDVAWPKGWSIGKPDAEIFGKPFKVPAEGVVPYQYTTVKTNFTEDKWLSAVEIHVTRPEVVHHVVVLFKAQGSTQPDALNGVAAVRVPGNYFAIFPEGTGRKIPKGAELIFQMHYTPKGVEVEDTPSLGMKFLDKAPAHELKPGAVSDVKFVIPAGNPNYQVTAQHTFTKATKILSLMPHMHVRGKAFRVERVTAAGEREILLDVPRYDFNWQHSHWAVEPIEFAAGDKLLATAWYDNSADNPSNPDPKVDVKFGEQTFEEMMIAYFDYL